jgi:hypothetical protein
MISASWYKTITLSALQGAISLGAIPLAIDLFPPHRAGLSVGLYFIPHSALSPKARLRQRKSIIQI